MANPQRGRVEGGLQRMVTTTTCRRHVGSWGTSQQKAKNEMNEDVASRGMVHHICRKLSTSLQFIIVHVNIVKIEV